MAEITSSSVDSLHSLRLSTCLKRNYVFQTQGPQKTGRWWVEAVGQVLFLSCLTANSRRRLEDSRRSWASMVKAERPLRQIAASSSHHDVITGASSYVFLSSTFHSFLWFFPSSFQRYSAGENKTTYALLYNTFNYSATDPILPPPSINLYHPCHSWSSPALSSILSCNYSYLLITSQLARLHQLISSLFFIVHKVYEL